MPETVIRVENLSKKYVLSHQAGRNRSMRESISGAAKSLGHRFFKPSTQEVSNSLHEDFWALKDVSFEIKQGDRVGIIGRNGAGKSTLLKILSRVTEPTSGKIGIKGRVASLLEVGTGFHQELSGRENIYLNGAILGMSKEEIKRKFDEIVAFAEIEKFLDTPVKRYSSGMYVRLAFAVAAHLEPEILIVDEVLAVGDANFQKKCLGKMQDVSKDEGRTVLFVSHNSDAIQRLCLSCIMMDRGQVIDYGETAKVMSRYLSGNSFKAVAKEWFDISEVARSMGNQKSRFVAVQYNSFNEALSFNPYPDGPLEFLLEIESNASRAVGSLAVTIYDQTGASLVNADTLAIGQIINLEKGRNLVRLRIEAIHLKPGIYMFGLWLADPLSGEVFDFIDSALEIELVDPGIDQLGIRPLSDGVVTCPFKLLPLEKQQDHIPFLSSLK
jgi:lipopolysaccharide transport system ATP-binding protein